jgi:hypothetical protein
MGVLYTKRLFTESNYTPSQIEMFFKLKVGPSGVRGNYATFESAGKWFVHRSRHVPMVY